MKAREQVFLLTMPSRQLTAVLLLLSACLKQRTEAYPSRGTSSGCSKDYSGRFTGMGGVANDNVRKLRVETADGTVSDAYCPGDALVLRGDAMKSGQVAWMSADSPAAFTDRSVCTGGTFRGRKVSSYAG